MTMVITMMTVMVGLICFVDDEYDDGVDCDASDEDDGGRNGGDE